MILGGDFRDDGPLFGSLGFARSDDGEIRNGWMVGIDVLVAIPFKFLVFILRTGFGFIEGKFAIWKQNNKLSKTLGS